jgi:hypothetical protein
LGEGGGEAIGVEQVVLRLKAGGQLAEFHVHVENLDGKLAEFRFSETLAPLSDRFLRRTARPDMTILTCQRVIYKLQ